MCYQACHVPGRAVAPSRIGQRRAARTLGDDEAPCDNQDRRHPSTSWYRDHVHTSICSHCHHVPCQNGHRSPTTKECIILQQTLRKVILGLIRVNFHFIRVNFRYIHVLHTCLRQRPTPTEPLAAMLAANKVGHIHQRAKVCVALVLDAAHSPCSLFCLRSYLSCLTLSGAATPSIHVKASKLPESGTNPVFPHHAF